MFRALCRPVLILLASTSVVAQNDPSSKTTQRVLPCTLHPVNGRVCLSEGVLRGFLIHHVAPRLPQGADENGQVVLHVIIPRTGGKPTKISVLSGDPALAHSAVRAVREWSFMAYVYQGEDVGMEGDLHIRFNTAK
jgi:TonB family protein